MKKYYRPPQGKYSESNLKMAKKMGYHTIFWSLAYVDWYESDQPTREEALEKMVPRIHPGAIVLLHSTSATNAQVLDENGNIVFYGLGSCYSYYDNSLNQLPEHVFVAKRGFYYGWMDTNGKWLYCQSIFSSINADDEMGY